ncbi:MAG: hypothetical protein ACK5NN_12670, partial [Sphingomonadaceae bacterium]
MSLTDINNAAIALNEAASAYNNQIAQIEAKKAELEDFVMNMFDRIAVGYSRVEYDNSVIHSKSGMAIPTDPLHSDRTQWAKISAISSRRVVGRENSTGVLALDTQYAFVAPPGYYEVPQYNNDASRCCIEVLAGDFADHNAVVAWLAAHPGFKTTLVGGWDVGGYNYKIPCTTNGFADLWIRFSNRSHA